MTKTVGWIWLFVALVFALPLPAWWGYQAYTHAYAAEHFRMPAPERLSHASGEAFFDHYRRARGSLVLRTPRGPLYLRCDWSGGTWPCFRDLHARGVREGDRLSVDYFTFRTAGGFDVDIIAAVRRNGLPLISTAQRRREVAESARFSSDHALMEGLLAAGLVAAGLIWMGLHLGPTGWGRPARRRRAPTRLSAGGD